MWRPHVCYVCKRSVCGGDEPQPVAHLSHKLQCARQSLKIMVSYGNKYPRHNARPHVAKQSRLNEHTAVCGSSVRQAVARPRHRQSVCIHNIHVAATCRPSVAATMSGHMWLNKVASVLGPLKLKCPSNPHTHTHTHTRHINLLGKHSPKLGQQNTAFQNK